ncbi:MAG TPA: acetyl-CoA carboxylase biotin carboxylase subunit, partial [Gemmatimonadaceae bacterium]|nr:acetyl-CoA carboxylase biotin carboxylase subunit [Gemmatimonadaceae bacterium]
PSGPGVRWDGGIETGSEIGLHYDPMLAKLIVWAPDREQAVTRMRRALVDLIVQGVDTSRDFHIRMMDDPEFQRGEIDIQWLERRLSEILQRKPSAEKTRVAAIAAALISERERVAPTVSRSPVAAQSSNGTEIQGDAWRRAALLEGLRD